MAEIARSLRDLYDPATGGNAFLIDGLTEPEVLREWLAKGVLGQTSNQTLFLQKVQAGEFDAEIARLKREGKGPAEIFNILYNAEALRSASVLEQWLSRDESLLFSRETDATRASDPEAVVAEADTLQDLSPWLMIKLANVGPSAEAIRAMIREAVARKAREGRGQLVNPNITLVFGPHHYVNTAAGYIEGLEEAKTAGADIGRIKSVNSLFVSRLDSAVDVLIDRRLSEADDPLLRLLKGKTAVANAKLIYRPFRVLPLGERLEDPEGVLAPVAEEAKEYSRRFQLLGPDAPIQRLLIASSSNKKPGVYSELIYVLPFFGPYVANTVPLKTLEALERKLTTAGIPRRDTIFDPLPWIEQTGETIDQWEDRVLQGGGPETRTPDEIIALVSEHVLAPAGTSLEQVTDELRDKGARKFAEDQLRAYEIFEEKLKTV